MGFYDVFNGDADGICGLLQLRFAFPRDALLVTGVKRDIRLLSRVAAAPGDGISVLDISLDANRAALDRVLAAGARVEWFDHHWPGEVPTHPALDAHIDTDASLCTSLIVDRYLGGRFRKWAVVAAFGDNLDAAAVATATAAGLDEAQTARLRALGVCMNYNAYGESVDDLMFPPAELYSQLRSYPDPLDFVRESPVVDQLQTGMREDLAKAAAAPVEMLGAGARVVMLPDARWARRVVGVHANALAREAPAKAHAVLIARARGDYQVSVRAPVAQPAGAAELVRRFASGGGREGAAGIDALPESDLERFRAAMRESYPGPG
jgi:hypothetical protein